MIDRSIRNRLALMALIGSICTTMPASGATILVELQNFSFNPPVVNATVGDTVKWVNKTSTFHTTTSGVPCNADGKWDMSLPTLNATFSFVFTSAGTYPCFCKPHCSFGMTGEVVVDDVTGIGEEPGTPRFKLLQNYPNPFASNTSIPLFLPREASFDIAIYDTMGRLVRRLFSGIGGPGRHTVLWEGGNDKGVPVPSGTYYYRLQVDGMTGDVRKMSLVR